MPFLAARGLHVLPAFRPKLGRLTRVVNWAPTWPSLARAQQRAFALFAYQFNQIYGLIHISSLRREGREGFRLGTLAVARVASRLFRQTQKQILP